MRKIFRFKAQSFDHQIRLFDIAAAYAFHLAEAQAFVDGNKRVAAAAEYLQGSAAKLGDPDIQMIENEGD